MKKIIVFSIIMFFLLLVSIGCVTNTVTPQVETPTSQVTATPTPTQITEEVGQLIKAEFFKASKKREDSITIEEGDGLMLEFDTELDLNAITSDAQQYIYIFCNKERIKNWYGTIYINNENAKKLMIRFEAGTNISCPISSLQVAPVKGKIKVKMGGYIKGIKPDIETLPSEPNETHEAVMAKMGSEPSTTEMQHWHEAHTPHPDMTPEPTHTPHPDMTPKPTHTPSMF